MNKKHAYLIMAHHRFDLLQRLVSFLDNENNDIYIHIDKKCKENIDIKAYKSKIVYIERMKVNWGGYSQIECTLNLIEAAIENSSYQYLHFMTGSTFPIKSLSYINSFFDENFPKEFIAFQNDKNSYISNYSRVKYSHLFCESGKTHKKNILFRKTISLMRKIYILIQKIFSIDRFKNYNLEFGKGSAYFSITQNFANYVINSKKLVYKMFKKSICGDECFMQTLILNSEFKKNIYDLKDEYNGSQVDACWPKFTNGESRINNNFILKDFEVLKNSKHLFALKFEGKDGLKLIENIISNIKETNNKL